MLTLTATSNRSVSDLEPPRRQAFQYLLTYTGDYNNKTMTIIERLAPMIDQQNILTNTFRSRTPSSSSIPVPTSLKKYVNRPILTLDSKKLKATAS